MELLLPVGSPEALYAAIEGGADAVYLGLDRFNARGRAKNFTRQQFLQAIFLAHENGIKVYLTLNTLVKNQELDELIELLSFIEQTGVDAVIVQDWGVYWLVKSHFPSITLHASTQMGLHNSPGAIMAQHFGFSRVVVSRELLPKEVDSICHASSVEVEVFVHGALCYCFSGSCFFSSWVGGMSANRGMCRQPCRRLFSVNGNDQKESVFSLADLQLAGHLDVLQKAGVASLKIEGRMKPAEYVYRVARAYRIVLDNPARKEEAIQILEQDYARDKTEYFFGHSLKNSLSRQTFAGKYVGVVVSAMRDELVITTEYGLSPGDRLRIQPVSGMDTLPVKVESIQHVDAEGKMIKAYLREACHPGAIQRGDKVYVIGTSRSKFPSRIKEKDLPILIRKVTRAKREEIYNSINRFDRLNLPSDEIVVRVDSIAWLSKMHADSVDAIILDMSMKDLQCLDFNRPVIKKNLAKLVVALPHLIQESRIPLVSDLVEKFWNFGISTFMVHQLWQLPILEDLKDIGLWLSENCYSLNDASIAMYKGIGVERYILPFENDYSNLASYDYRDGIVPVYFTPRLFTSRMPVMKNGDICTDSTGRYQNQIRDGISVLYPDVPVSLLHKRDDLMSLGYRSFLLDFSHEKPSGNTFARLMKAYHEKTPVQPSSLFNFKEGLH